MGYLQHAPKDADVTSCGVPQGLARRHAEYVFVLKTTNKNTTLSGLAELETSLEELHLRAQPPEPHGHQTKRCFNPSKPINQRDSMKLVLSC